MSVLSALGPLVHNRSRKETLLALTAAYMLVQLSSLPVAIALPTLAKAFGTGVDDAAWIVIIYLMMLGAFVLLGARMGDRYGHARVFFIGIRAVDCRVWDDCALTGAVAHRRLEGDRGPGLGHGDGQR